jgi:hypothetical protein
MCKLFFTAPRKPAAREIAGGFCLLGFGRARFVGCHPLACERQTYSIEQRGLQKQ